MESGSAAERFVSDAATFDRIVAAATRVDHHLHVGGNAALMALLLSQSCNVLLGGPVGSQLKSLLPDSIELATPVEKDQVHLIFEYSTGTSWGSFSAPRANRLIVVRDAINGRVGGLEGTHDALSVLIEQRRVPLFFIAAGLHLLADENDRTQRLSEIQSQIRTFGEISPSTLLHFEMASVADLSFVREMCDAMLPLVRSIGLNEQELAAAYVALGGSKHSFDDFKKPKLRVAVDALLLLFDRYGTLTRIHFHYLSYHIVAIRRGFHDAQSEMAGVAAGSLIATRMACNRTEIIAETVDLFNDQLDERHRLDQGFIHWPESNYDFYIAPVLACKKAVRTVGLGDNISAMGLLYSVGKPK